MQEKYIVTAAFPYANGPIHIGHLAGVYFPADVFVRFLRKKKKNVLFISGSDEHGVPIAIQAQKEKKTPQEIVNKYHNMIYNCFLNFGIQFDNYFRTSKKIHHKIASSFFMKLYKNNQIFQKTSNQYYDPNVNQFLSDRYLCGICPYCKEKDAYGDQCESCGSSLSTDDLIHPKSMISGAHPILKQTQHWYFPLNKYQKFLENWILENHKKDWKINVYGQSKSWLEQGLKPRAITRDLTWGVHVPIENNKGKVLYVWFEAPIGYISSTIEWAKQKHTNWKDYWKNPQTKLIQFIGKDNIVFHCIMFPVMLKAYNSGYILPHQILANEFLNLENRKISTSRNWAVWAHEYLIDFPNQQDTLRYVLLSNMPETKDNNFNWKDFQRKNNNELVAVLGNFIQRNFALVQKYYQGMIPNHGMFSEKDQNMLENIQQYPKKIRWFIESYKLRESLSYFMKLARLGNKYLTEEEPWKRKNAKRVPTILYVSMQIVVMLAQLSELFLPYTSQKLFGMLRVKSCSWDQLENGKNRLDPGHRLGDCTLLFQKINNESIHQQIQKLHMIQKK
ncbi:methionine--tRNA ligase [Blattabacterium cuenoti]|uniref:methionine--tRNA ligase n=1 Tax=Blattabacterium cuenoti TaxID=1653831 RepID=UPI00163C815B